MKGLGVILNQRKVRVPKTEQSQVNKLLLDLYEQDNQADKIQTIQ